MDLVGHCVVAELSGVFPERDIYGPRIVELMFLNYMHCHDWAYENCWRPSAFGELENVATLIRAHMVCDWVIHYGAQRETLKKKRGWAYQRMMLAGKRRDQFFKRALDQALLVDGSIIPTSRWSKKERLDFDHSLVEYALDFLLCPRYISSERFRAIQEGLSRLCLDEGYGSSTWAFELYQKLGAASDRSHEFILTSMRQLGRDAMESASGEDFCVRTTIHKYGLKLIPESHAYVKTVLTTIANQINEAEVTVLCDSIAAVISQPQTE